MHRASSYVPHSPKSPYGENLQIKRGNPVGAKGEKQSSKHAEPGQTAGPSKVPPVRIAEVKERLREELPARDPRMFRRNALPRIARMSRQAVDHTIKGLLEEMSPAELQRTNSIIDNTTRIIEGSEDSDAIESAPETVEVAWADSADLPIDSWGTLDDDAELEADIVTLLQCMKAAAAEHPGDSPDAQQQRSCAIIDFLGKLLRNEFQTDAARTGANVFNVGLRTIMVVLLCKLMGDAIAFEVSRASKLDDDILRSYASILAIAIAPIFNLVGAISSGLMGTANRTSILARAILGILNLVVLLGCYMTGSLEVLGLALVPVVSASLARDICNYFFPLKDNLRSLPFRGVAKAGAFYAFLQWLLGDLATSKAAPFYGAHGIPTAVGNGTVVPELLRRAKLNLQDSGVHAFMMGILEFFDDFTVTLCVKRIENAEYLEKAKAQLLDEAVHKESIEELSNVAKALLETPATERQRKINQMNAWLYARELERMNDQEKDGLNEAQKLYLADLRDMHQCFIGNIEEMPSSMALEHLRASKHVRDFELRLGFYKRTRERDRLLSCMKRVDWTQLDQEHLDDLIEINQYMERLMADIEICQEQFAELKEKKKGSPVGPDGKKLFSEEQQKLLESLQFEFDDETELPPMSLLRGDAHKTPDFTRFDKRVNRLCRRLSPGMERERRKKLVEELFVYEFVRGYLPRELTPTEAGVLGQISKEKPRILPSELTNQWPKKVRELRREEGEEGPRIGFGRPPLFCSVDEAANRLGTALLVTDAARQNVVANVNGVLTFLWAALAAKDSTLTEDSDDFTTILFWGMVLGMAVFMNYVPMYLLHREGESPNRPAKRPGAEGLPRLRKEPETLEDVITPRGRGNNEVRDDRRRLSEAQSEKELSVEVNPLDPYSARQTRPTHDDVPSLNEQSSDEASMDSYEVEESVESDEDRESMMRDRAPMRSRDSVTRLTDLPLDLSDLSDTVDPYAPRKIQSME